MYLSSPLLKKAFVIFIIICANEVYRIAAIPESIRDLIQTAGIGLILLILLIDGLYKSGVNLKQYFKIEMYMLIFAVFFSMFIAFYYHNQDFKTSLIVQRYMYFIGFYFLLHRLKLPGSDIENIILLFGFAYVVFFLFQYAIYPIEFFDIRIDADRGTLRIFLPGAALMFFAYYKYLQRFLTTQNLKYGAFVVLFFLVGALLQGTRQLMASVSLLTVLFIIFNKDVRSRILMILLSVLAGIAIFIILYDMFMEILEATQYELSRDEPNVRLLAINYFMNDFMPADIAYIFGNGQDSINSPFGKHVNMLKRVFGFYQSDIGIIGDYSKFGLLFVIAQLSIYGRIVFGKLHPNLEFLRYMFIGLTITLFTGRNYLGNPGGIVFICAVCYLIDYYKNFTKNPELIQKLIHKKNINHIL